MNKESELRLYEMSYLAKAIDEAAAVERASSISSALEKEHGIIASQSQPFKKALSFPVKKETEAWFGWIKFMAKTETAANIKEKLKENDQILRFTLAKAAKDSPIERQHKPRKIMRKTAPDKQASIAEIDKKLEEMLGK